MSKILIGLLTLVFALNATEIYATFTVTAEKKAMLAFDASGIVQKVNYGVSSSVTKGAVLASLINADSEAKLQSAKTVLKFAKKDYERQLKVKDLIDEGKFDQYAFKYENAKNQLSIAQAQYDKTYLKAPFDGVIYEKNIEIGDTVSALMLKTVFKIQSKHRRKLILEFDQKYHKSVKVGQNFRYGVDGDDKEYRGIIMKVYPFANSGNRKIKAEVKAEDFIVGLFGEGYITTPDAK
ncbi:HlyD family efflux transporter periplasmic adaptor subunit [Sulfurimonas sp. SAG-AH-194-L11]|nr:HlyD family efflux transporter periplasmic adaptor subunit [Sulfurimonas sp. SAG-AH-194-L11]MDF1877142.1 HlyD family efflux transporter periplasmic adaptor subunit [Sulfurimonas sp. SAG-AH-194-L11]